ncbi:MULTISPECIES: YesL family protein [Paenibacillus]|uniref:YesL family protein n=1 Tax=Paenibacillus TaxID=44249 RepID=UPI00035D4CD4|nr:DUF624 domain-containing protein [Paenibacillus massiliensis]
MIQFVETVNAWCMRILRLVYLNLLWTGGTLLGLVLFGIGPATIAMMSVLRQWIRGNEEVPVFTSFVKYYKESFKEGSILGLIYTVVGYVLYIDLANISSWYLRVVIFVGIFLYLISLLYIFPLVSHYDWKGIWLKVRMSLIIGFSNLQYTLVLMVGIALIYFLILNLFPGILTFAGASLIGYLVMWMTHQVFSRMERKAVAKEEDIALQK